MRYAITICLAGAALSLPACGGTSSPGAGGSTSPEDAAASNGKALQFATCMPFNFGVVERAIVVAGQLAHVDQDQRRIEFDGQVDGSVHTSLRRFAEVRRG